MRRMDLTTERLFRSGEFKRVPESYLIKKDNIRIFPCQIWVAKGPDGNKTAVGVCPRSKRWGDFSLNRAMLDFLLACEKSGRIKKAYAATATGEENNDILELNTYRTIFEQVQLVEGVEMSDGEHGPFYWLNANGEPAVTFGKKKKTKAHEFSGEI